MDSKQSSPQLRRLYDMSGSVVPGASGGADFSGECWAGSKRKSEPCGTRVLAIVDRELEIRACGEIYRKGQLMNREGERENSHYLKHKHEHKALASRSRQRTPVQKHRGEPVHAGQRPVPVHCTTKEQRPGTRCNINYGSRISSTRATTALSTTAAAATAAFASTWACMYSAGVGSAAASLSQGV